MLTERPYRLDLDLTSVSFFSFSFVTTLIDDPALSCVFSLTTPFVLLASFFVF